MIDYQALLAYGIIIVLAVSLYLKKTHQTLPELVRSIFESIEKIGENFDGYTTD